MYAFNIAIIIIFVLLEGLYLFLNGHQSKRNAPTSSSERPKVVEEQPLSPSPRSSFNSAFPRRPSPFDPTIVGKKKADQVIEEKNEDSEVWICKYCKEKNEINSKRCYFCSFKKSSKRFHPAIKRSTSIGKYQAIEPNSSVPIEGSLTVQPASTDNNNDTIDPLYQLKDAISNDKPELQVIESSEQFCRGLLKRGTLLSEKKVKKRFHNKKRLNNQKKLTLLMIKLMSFGYDEATVEDEEEDAHTETTIDQYEENNEQEKEGGSVYDDEDDPIEGPYIEEAGDDEQIEVIYY